MISPKLLKEVTSNLTVLYVEDEESLRRGMVSSLERLFKNVLVGCDGLEGLELFKNNAVDLIITDINMPNMNGVDMLREINKEEFPPPICGFNRA